MKKIPTVFVREYENHKVTNTTSEFTSEDTKFAFENGIATVKYDGACCAIIDGELYKRYDAKNGKKAPQGAIPCCEADPITGHHPHWVKVDENNPADKWFVEAYKNTENLTDGTYEAVGVHFQGNPYGYENDCLIRHGEDVLEDIPRTFDGIKDFLEKNYM